MLMTKDEIVGNSMNYNIDEVIERYALDHDIPIEIAREHEVELKRFLALIAINPSKKYGMAGVVDNLWHTFIFYTKSYFDFCKAVNQGYIHHTPENKLGRRDPKPYLEMLADYESVFGSKAPAHIWPDISVSNLLGNACGGSCRSCGNGCSSCGHGCTGCTRCGS